MNLQVIEGNFVISKIQELNIELLSNEFVFISITDQEISVVCKNDLLQSNVIEKEEGYKLIQIEGMLDFSLIGIIAKISTILASEMISIFVISTFNTDYFLVKEGTLKKTKEVLCKNGYTLL